MSTFKRSKELQPFNLDSDLIVETVPQAAQSVVSLHTPSLLCGGAAPEEWGDV